LPLILQIEKLLVSVVIVFNIKLDPNTIKLLVITEYAVTFLEISTKLLPFIAIPPAISHLFAG